LLFIVRSFRVVGCSFFIHFFGRFGGDFGLGFWVLGVWFFVRPLPLKGSWNWGFGIL
jgi:hypothetical protein